MSNPPSGPFLLVALLPSLPATQRGDLCSLSDEYETGCNIDGSDGEERKEPVPLTFVGYVRM